MKISETASRGVVKRLARRSLQRDRANTRYDVLGQGVHDALCRLFDVSTRAPWPLMGPEWRGNARQGGREPVKGELSLLDATEKTRSV
jgi:hypothetical protein